MSLTDVPTVRHNPHEARYELLLGGRLIGVVDYRADGDAVALVHTEIDPAHRRRGLGKRLVAGALRDLRERGLRAVPVCPFVVAYARDHPGAAAD